MDELSVRIERRLRRLADENVVTRIWHRDHTVWNPDPTEIADRLGWLDVAGKMHDRVGELLAFAAAVAEEGYEKVVLLGMGGSSLAPEVIRKTYGVAGGRPDLTVLDTTHPGAIARVRGSLDRDRTLFIVASKSGSTVETLSHCRYFLQEIKRGEHFVAITDPGSALENLARTEGFRAVFLNPSDIGGRYSALSLFGLLPGALIGADLRDMLERAEEMARACRGTEENPGAWLGVVMAEAALAGRDKLTLVLPSGIASFGGWVEQLIAESTGKDGTGILPVVGESLGDSGIYGDDRLFVSIGSAGGRLEAIEEAGQPVVRLAGGCLL